MSEESRAVEESVEKKLSEEEVLEAFNSPDETGTNESRALELLSQLSKPPKTVWNSKYGRTLVHYACINGWYDVVTKLVDHYHCKADVRDKGGDTPLYWACENGHLDAVRYLVKKHNCNPEHGEYVWGWTPFQRACRNGYLSIVKFLMTECDCDPLKHDRYGGTPLSEACNENRYDVIAYLLSTGKLDKASENHFMNKSTALKLRKHPFRPAFKIFVIGNQSAGKSTLVKAIQNRLTDTSLLSSVTGRFKKVSRVELRTAGIIPVHIQSPKLGHIIVYDLAGQYEYYTSHAAYMENVMSSLGVLLLLVVDLSKSMEEIVYTLQYWNSFIANLCSKHSEKPQIMIAGSHADVVKSQGEQPSQKLSEAHKKLTDSLLTTTSVVLNCTQAVSSVLDNICDSIAKNARVYITHSLAWTYKYM